MLTNQEFMKVLYIVGVGLGLGYFVIFSSNAFIIWLGANMIMEKGSNGLISVIINVQLFQC